MALVGDQVGKIHSQLTSDIYTRAWAWLLHYPTMPPVRRNRQRLKDWMVTLSINLLPENKKNGDAIKEHLDGLPVGFIKCAVWQEEVGEGGYEHFQMFLRLHEQLDLGVVKRRLNLGDGPHLEPRRGNPAQCHAYCTKANTRVNGPWYWPDERAFDDCGPGARTDLKLLAAAIEGGATVREVAAEFPASYIKYHRGINELHNALRKAWDRANEREVYIILGPAGRGKTRWVYDRWGDANVWRAPPKDGKQWFNGYNGQQVALFDEHCKSNVLGVEFWKQLTDRYPITLEFKGGFTEWTPSVVVFTANASSVAAMWGSVPLPQQPDPADISAIERRCEHGGIFNLWDVDTLGMPRVPDTLPAAPEPRNVPAVEDIEFPLLDLELEL